MQQIKEEEKTERVGNLDMRICDGEPNAESDERWQRRSEALAAWLLDQWQREQRQRMAERN